MSLRKEKQKNVNSDDDVHVQLAQLNWIVKWEYVIDFWGHKSTHSDRDPLAKTTSVWTKVTAETEKKRKWKHRLAAHLTQIIQSFLWLLVFLIFIFPRTNLTWSGVPMIQLSEFRVCFSFYFWFCCVECLRCLFMLSVLIFMFISYQQKMFRKLLFCVALFLLIFNLLPCWNVIQKFNLLLIAPWFSFRPFFFSIRSLIRLCSCFCIARLMTKHYFEKTETMAIVKFMRRPIRCMTDWTNWIE